MPEVLVIEFIDAKLTPALDCVPEAEPVREIVPLPVVVETAPVPLTLIPLAAAVVLAPPMPINVMPPPPLVLSVPAVSETPWQAPVVLRPLAMMKMA